MKLKAAGQSLRRWTRQEYERMIAAGIFTPGERSELIDGEIVTMTPQGSGHATAIRLVEEALRVAFGPGSDVRVQLPLALDDISEPEPDVSVVRGTPRDFRDAHPNHALLVVEVADTTLTTDRQKSGLYARAGIQELWIVNLVNAVVEVYREPVVQTRTRYGWEYRLVHRHGPDEAITPLASPESRIAVVDLLP